MEERTFVDAHGVEVFSRWWPTDEARGTVVIAHGACEHSGRYDRFALALNAAGLHAVAIDHRGHGRTGASTGAGVMGPGGGQAIIDDLHELRAAACARFGESTPVFLFGHSMGSSIALGYLTQHSAGLTGAVLCGVPGDVEQPSELRPALEEAAAAGLRDEPAVDLLAAQNEVFEPARTPFDWLSRDPDEVDRYIGDAFCGDGNPLTLGFLLDLLDALEPARERLAAISCPVLVIAGDQDPAAGMGAHATTMQRALRQAGVATDLHLYEGARHEILNETNRDEVTADVVGWFAARLAGVGATAAQ